MSIHNKIEKVGRVHAAPPRKSGAEWLVGVGFRCWLAGYDTGDIACWETGWNAYARTLGTERAKRAVTELACWVRAVRASASRNAICSASITRSPSRCGSGISKLGSMTISGPSSAISASTRRTRACSFVRRALAPRRSHTSSWRISDCRAASVRASTSRICALYSKNCS